jgi:hypothetical protein
MTAKRTVITETSTTPGTDATPSTPPPPPVALKRFGWRVRNIFADCIGDIEAKDKADAERIVRGWLTDGLALTEK